MKKPTLAVLALGLGLTGALFNSSNASDVGVMLDSQGNVHTTNRHFQGEVTHIDEDSFVIWADKQLANYQFENVRVTNAVSGKTVKLVSPGPTSYKLGDNIEGSYMPDNHVTPDEIISRGASHRVYRGYESLQNFVIGGDGIIISSEFVED